MASLQGRPSHTKSIGAFRVPFAILSLILLLIFHPSASQAQSFFASLVVDPTVGADRGSASQLQKVEETTSFLTFSTTGSEEAGPVILGYGIGVPDLVMPGDQLDGVAVWGGPSEDGWRELLAGGVAYRFPVSGLESVGFINVDYGDLVLGTTETLALDVRGDRLQVAAGLIHERELGNEAELKFGVELIARDLGSELLGVPVIDEKLRMLRASVLYTKGIPLLFQQRLAASLTKGFSAFGASSESNPFASVPGATTDFLRVSVAAEASVPLSREWVVNAGVIGQWTDQRLPASQRCGFETNAYARGFDYATVIGDRCIGTRVELAYNFELPAPERSRTVFTQGFVGIDGGRIDTVATPLFPGNKDSWSSMSVGVRSLRGNFLGEVAATRILDRPSGTEAQDDNRIWIRAALKF
ncbi:ShlB/FhaC/HecB family hemolysin secretion/activation protein [Silicimonas sp. MF1-12-2]|uniref:ShlB/FhaC/HecB family hemolysin secretion/activation protein n=1 Tax=Silicimonas sp. MF1-12-2 TaxID=3384793 RepID=UPI0039B6B2EB